MQYIEYDENTIKNMRAQGFFAVLQKIQKIINEGT